MKILFVCLGNICRSPLAEGIMVSKIKEHNLDWIVDSAGTGGYHIGDLPDNRSIEVAKKHGIDITNQRGRKVRSIDFKEFDYIFAMDNSNYRDLNKLALDHERQKIKLILNEIYPNENRNVPDPYYGGDNGFEEVFDMLEKACEAIILKYSVN